MLQKEKQRAKFHELRETKRDFEQLAKDQPVPNHFVSKLIGKMRQNVQEHFACRESK